MYVTFKVSFSENIALEKYIVLFKYVVCDKVFAFVNKNRHYN